MTTTYLTSLSYAFPSSDFPKLLQQVYIESGATAYKGCKSGEKGKLKVDSAMQAWSPFGGCVEGQGPIGSHLLKYPADDSDCGINRDQPCNYCSPCEDGFISNTAQTTCTRCPPGTRSNGNKDECIPCLAGTASVGGFAECESCELGSTYQPNTGAAFCFQCTPCGLGTEISSQCTLTSDSVCNACDPSFAGLGGLTSCESCDGEREYSDGGDEAGQAVCDLR